MNILALDTSMGACSVAVIIDGAHQNGGLFRAYDERVRGHAEALMPMVRDVMGQAKLSYDEIDRIAVTLGPGTFTGVRVGVAAARGLSLAIGVPIVGATSLSVMAWRFLENVEDFTEDKFLVVSDARRGEFYVQAFSAKGIPLFDAEALTPSLAAERLGGGFNVAVGNGAGVLSRTMAEYGFDLDVLAEDLLPDAAFLAQRACDLSVSGTSVKPLYLRPPDAKPQIGKSIERARPVS